MRKSLPLLSLLVALSAMAAIRAVETVRRKVGNAEVTFRQSDGVEHAVAVKIGGTEYRVLAPGQDPVILTDGKRFFEAGATFRLDTEWKIGFGGRLEGLVNGKPLEKKNEFEEDRERHVRAQLQAELFSQPRDRRPGDATAVEQFLLDSIPLTQGMIQPKGHMAGASLLFGGKSYIFAGNRRYPGIVNRDSKTFYLDDDAQKVFALQLEPKAPFLSAIVVDDPRAKSFTPPLSIRQAYAVQLLDNWKGISEAKKQKLTPIVTNALPGEGKTLEIKFDQGILPERYRAEEFVDEKNRPLSPKEIQRRALNFALNLVSSHDRAVPARIREGSGGVSIVETAPFLDPIQVGRILRDNPYACTAGEMNQVRLDWLLSHLQKDDVYREAAGVPDSFAAAARDLGVSVAFEPNRKENRNVGIEVSMVAHGIRVGNRQLQKKKGNKPFYQTFDFAVDAKGNLADPRSDFRTHPSGFPHTAGEYIYHRANDYHAYAVYLDTQKAPVLSPDGKLDFVFTKAGDSLAAAPDSVVNDSETKFGPFIHNPRSCLDCHRGGLRTAIDQTPSDPASWMLSEEKYNADAKLKAAYPSYKKYVETVNQYFGDATSFIEDAEKDSDANLKAIERSEAFVAKAKGSRDPLLPEFHFRYNDKVSPERAAKELGTDLESLQRVLSLGLRGELGPLKFDPATRVFRRADFEQAFCDLKAALAKAKGEGKAERTPGPSQDHKTH